MESSQQLLFYVNSCNKIKYKIKVEVIMKYISGGFQTDKNGNIKSNLRCLYE